MYLVYILYTVFDRLKIFLELGQTYYKIDDINYIIPIT